MLLLHMKTPNATLQARPEAGAERTLEGVACKPLLNEALRAVSEPPYIHAISEGFAT